MRQLAPLPRALTAILLTGAVLFLVAFPICASKACPMAKMDRALCRAMGLDCCSSSGGSVSHGSPQLAPPDLVASVVTLVTATVPAAAGHGGPFFLAPAAPAVIQGVRLHTLFGLFRI